MTDARLVWDTWRRILTTDDLAEAALAPGYNDAKELGLSAGEFAVLADYASTPVATETTINAYRSGLVRNALAALNLVPGTRRLLDTSGLDESEVAADFVQTRSYRDDGPMLWGIAADFVAYLGRREEFCRPTWQDLLKLDRVAIALVRRLGKAIPATWPDSAADNAVAAIGTGRYVANPAADTASSRFDLTPWLENPLEFDPEQELQPSARQWLVYVPAIEAAHTYAELSERAAQAFSMLAVSKTPAELSEELRLPLAEVLDVIDSLTGIGAVLEEKTQ